VRKVTYICFLIVLLIFLVSCEKVHTKQIADCNTVEPPNALNTTVPEWEIKPNMLLYEAKPKDDPKPLSIVSYEVILKNLGTDAARNIHVFIGNELFGWERMNFDSKSELACSELQPNQFNIWVWSHGWDTHLDPSWRSTMEQTAQLRFVWEDTKGWHQVQGHLPTQYYSQSFMAKDLKPLPKKAIAK
jgi:hypothetical protein